MPVAVTSHTRTSAVRVDGDLSAPRPGAHRGVRLDHEHVVGVLGEVIH